MKKTTVTIVIAAAIALLLGAGLLHGRGGKGPGAGEASSGSPLAREAHPGDAGHHEEGGETGHGPGGEELSDLDRPVDELWARKCEHGRLAHDCDSCRFEVGAVRLAPAVVGDGSGPGLVGVVAAGGKSYRESRSFTGEVGLSEGRTVRVTSPLPGTVRTVFADIGGRVAAGAPLFEIDSHEVADARGEYLKKHAARELAQRTAARERNLFERKISAEAEVLEASARLAEADVDLANARSRLLRLGLPEDEIAAIGRKALDGEAGHLLVRAPRAGTVLERRAGPGERIDPGRDLFVLSDLSEVWVWADLREGDIPAVARTAGGNGGTLPAVVRGPGGREHRGTLDALSGAMHEPTRTLKARIVVPNPDGLLRPGMFVTVRVLIPGGEGRALAVPKAAVLADEGRFFVFVHKEGDYWIRRPVTLGRDLGDMMEIAGGLSAGQKVVADGAFLLKSDVLRSKMGAGCAD